MAIALRSIPTPRMTWQEICLACPGEFVILLDIDDGPDGWIASARVLDHDTSSQRLLARSAPDPDSTLTHTSRPLWGFPKFCPEDGSWSEPPQVEVEVDEDR